MSLARVVSFEGVTSDHMQEVERRIAEEGRPEEIPATEIIILHDPEAETSLAVVFFDNEDDYRKGDAALSAMPASDTPGRRTSVTKYRVAVRATP